MEISWRETVQNYLPEFKCLPSQTPVSREYSIFVASRMAGFVGEDRVVNLSQRLAQDLSRIDILVSVGMALRQAEGRSSGWQIMDLPYSLLKDMKDGDSRVVTLDGEVIRLTADQSLQPTKPAPTFVEAINQIKVEGIRYVADTPSELMLPLEMGIGEVNTTIVSEYIIRSLTQRTEVQPAPAAPLLEEPRRCC